MKLRIVLGLVLFLLTCTLEKAGSAVRATSAPAYDAIIRNGLIIDGTGGVPRRLDVGIRADRIVYIGNLQKAEAGTIIDAKGLVVAPGFINMLSWAVDDLIADGRSQGDIRQGVTTEIFGEGDSMGPLTATCSVARSAWYSSMPRSKPRRSAGAK